jgi:hypothetical protein
MDEFLSEAKSFSSAHQENFLGVKDEVHRSDQLISSRAVIEGSGIIRMIEAKLGPKGNENLPSHKFGFGFSSRPRTSLANTSNKR